MHDRGRDLEKAVSLPSLLSNFSVRDQQHWLNMIMEAAGINEQVERLEHLGEEELEEERMPAKKMQKMLAKTRALYDKEVH